jgi:hypothetical protein
MKLLYAKTPLYAILLITIFSVGCKNINTGIKTTISVASFKKATLDTGKILTLLQILHTYPAQMDCNTNEKYANLYVCKKFTNGDTVYVFEECKKVARFALDTSFHYAAVIDKDNMVIHSPDEVTVFVPANFRIPINAKYFFAKLDYLTEY